MTEIAGFPSFSENGNVKLFLDSFSKACIRLVKNNTSNTFVN